MSAHNSFAIFNTSPDFHLVSQLVGVNLDCLEKMVSTQFSPLKGGVPPSGVRAEGVGFAVGALQGPHGGRDQEVIGELR